MAKLRNIALPIVLISLDQMSKYIIRTSGGFYICNKNIAFGINLPNSIFYILWIIIVSIIIISITKYKIQDTKYAIFILSGAISNIADRLVFGCVTDFIDFKIWPVFNLSDIFITLGAIMLIYKNIMEQKQKD